MRTQTRIIVVEDNPVMLRMVADLLTAAGYEVREAATGTECLQMVMADKPDIVILDVYLPDTYGYDVCRQIKTTPGLEDVCIIYLSSSPATDEMKVAGFDVGADDYIIRPVSDKELLARVKVMERIHLTEKRLRESEERYRIAIEYSNDGVAIIRGDKYLYVNQRFMKMFGLTDKEEVAGKEAHFIAHPDDREKLAEAIENWASSLDDPSLFEFVGIRRDGTAVHIEASITHMTYDGELAVLVLLRDVTERKKAEETIRQLAYYDALTGLPNRILLYDRLTVAIAQAQRTGRKLAVMMLDLNKFKAVNDTMGHAAGDMLLKAVAGTLTRGLRKQDTVSRLGGDEFIVVTPDVADPEDVAKLAQKISGMFQDPFDLDGQAASVGTSIGIAIYPDDGADIETLIRHADAAMYNAKQSGQNQYRFYTPESSLP